MIIIDASVATKLINTQEEGSEKALSLLSRHIHNQEKILVPQLLFLEVANALATKSNLEKSYIEKGISLLYKANFVIFDVSEKDIIEASFLAKEQHTSVYDMLYAVIAKSKKINLITSDKRFVTKVGWPSVKHLDTIGV